MERWVGRVDLAQTRDDTSRRDRQASRSPRALFSPRQMFHQRRDSYRIERARIEARDVSPNGPELATCSPYNDDGNTRLRAYRKDVLMGRLDSRGEFAFRLTAVIRPIGKNS